jgi:hypothetical protein
MWPGLSGGSPEGLNWTGETESVRLDENGDLPHGDWGWKEESRDRGWMLMSSLAR